jgi:hypothetical protein
VAVRLSLAFVNNDDTSLTSVSAATPASGINIGAKPPDSETVHLTPDAFVAPAAYTVPSGT